jgi:hypothetical protein
VFSVSPSASVLEAVIHKVETIATESKRRYLTSAATIHDSERGVAVHRARGADAAPRSRALLIALAGAWLLIVLWRWRPAVPTGRCAPDIDIVRGCALLAWAIAGYLTGMVTVAALCRLPAPGDSPRADRLIPGLVRRRMEAAIRVGVLCAVLGAPALPAAAFASTTSTPRLVAHCANATTPSNTAADDPLDWPGLAGKAAHTAGPSRFRNPDAGLVTGGRPSRRSSLDAGNHIVGAGDTLWAIARSTLPDEQSAARVTAEWHRWYAANRSVIGADPDLIRPGQDLRQPTGRPPAGHRTPSDPRSPQ